MVFHGPDSWFLQAFCDVQTVNENFSVTNIEKKTTRKLHDETISAYVFQVITLLDTIKVRHPVLSSHYSIRAHTIPTQQ
jgi:hypothetical protein